MPESVQTDVLIVGAGMSGLMAAQALKARAVQTLLVDKGRSVGGRMATRRLGEGVADHGAQFFTVRDPAFQAHVDAWQEAGLVFVWSRGWSDGSVTDTPRDGHPRYAVHGGLNALPKFIARDLDCHLDVTLDKITRDEDGWHGWAGDEAEYRARVLLLTPPVPQSLALLSAGSVALHPEDAAALERIEYAPCLCAMFVIEGDVYLPDPGALQRPYADMAWIADNMRKGISPAGRVITMQASFEYSRAHFDAPDGEVTARFTAELVPFMKPDAHIREVQIKRWRYAQPTSLYPDRCKAARGLPLIFAGDAFAGPRVEGAALSGLAAAQAVLELLST